MISFIATAVKGELDFGSEWNYARLRSWLQDNDGKILRLTKDDPVRSLPQNSLYWAWLDKVSWETGNETDALHSYLKAKFLPRRLIKVKGKIEHELEVEGTTAKLSKAEFSEFLDRCAAHVGIPLPTIQEIESMGYIKN